MSPTRQQSLYDGHSSAVSSVLHNAASGAYSETKQGAYIYWGDAGNFHEWEFRTKLRLKGGSKADYADRMSKVVDGLRGDAFVVATQIGLDTLSQPPTNIPDSFAKGKDKSGRRRQG